MPKIFGVNILAIFLAAIAFYMLGWLWYGSLFMEQWMKLTGVHGDGGMKPLTMVLGFAICLLPAFGIAMVINWARAHKLYSCIKIGIGLALLIVLPTLLSGNIYQAEPIALLIIDASHTIIGFGLMAAIIGYFRQA